MVNTAVTTPVFLMKLFYRFPPSK